MLFIGLHAYLIFRPIEFAIFSTYYPLYVIALGVTLFNIRQIKFNGDLLLIICCCSILTLLAVANSINNDLFERRYIFHWFAWLVILLFVMTTIKNKLDKAKLSLIAKMILLFQLLTLIIQLFEPQVLGGVWSSAKNVGLDSYVRVTGSLPSPIALSSFVTYLVIWIIAHKNPLKEFIWVLLGAFMIIMSASRTLILIYPFVIGAWFYLEGNTQLYKRLTKAMAFTVVLFIFIFSMLFAFKNTFVYSSELLSILPSYNGALASGNELKNDCEKYYGDGYRSVNRDCKYEVYLQEKVELTTYSLREQVWLSAFNDFYSKSTLEIFIGDGMDYSHKSAHQDPLFVLTRYGIIGLVVYLILLARLLSLAYNNRETFEGKVLYLVCLLIIGAGFVNTVGVEMRLGILTAIAAGLALSNKVTHITTVTSHDK